MSKKSFINQTKQSLSKLLKFEIQPKTSVLLLGAVGFGLSVAIPLAGNVSAADLISSTPNKQLISQQPETVELTLVSYAVTQAAYDRIIPLFQEKWKREHGGQEVRINASYGGSGTQTRAVIDGLEADVVALALALDTKKIENAGLIDPGWESEAPNNSIITHSVVALVTRPGNPKGIRNWTDLTRPDVKVITANPKTSGGARWNFLALWNAVNGDDSQKQDFVTQVFRNVPVLPKDAREASDTFFKKGEGDVLLNYENEVILSAQRGETSSFSVIPSNNISIDGPVAVVDKNVDKHNTRAVAEAFVQFLFTPEAQREFANVGFRPVDPTVARDVASRFPRVTNLHTISEFGGWDNIQKKFFDDGAIFDQIQGSL